MPEIDLNSLDAKNRWNREFPTIPDLVMQIAEMKKVIEAVRIDDTTHPSAKGYFQAAMDNLDRAAVQLHHGSTL